MEAAAMVGLDPGKALRVVGRSYRRTRCGVVETWTGKRWHCEHDKQRTQYKLCGGTSVCEHSKRRSTCKKCGGTSVCTHDKQRSQCKLCGGTSICEHRCI